MRQHPPFRADVVGSFLRPAAVQAARIAHADGTVDAVALRAVEDDAIRDLMDAQQAAGLQLATDGEARRAWWHLDFWGGLDGVEVVELDHGIAFHGVTTTPKGMRVTGPVSFPADHPFVADAAFVVAEAAARGVTAKFTIPSPTVFDFRLDADQIRTDHYADRDAITDDLVQAYRDAIAALYAVGVRYLQIDDTAWAYACSEAEMVKARERGIETDGIAARFSSIIRRVLDGRPEDLVVTTHVCRGNFRSTWITSGGYEPVAEELLGNTGYDGYFLEYDSDRAGGFEPLRFLPEGDQVVVLGLVTSKTGELEDPAVVEQRIRDAAAFAPLGQLALSPQCGFASTEEGNVLSEDEQWAKVRSVVDIASRVWS
ncbi:5-methyltetrahydropteroyltriglutamate--homocysteine S-methyltransferase [Curtobacterium sp. MCPF17_002]|uniref:5-methyltetrahydropteroyltriglutamate-- homocysteine S-methyltransferase n=1 Tax=Curtobacterium sp. MCPF17_002 TaxID=2175645 RepID=UPI000DA968C1|nr:5-methyltetrahydropteroyltriglutamate--homocysteine S-methyltransferase [Curtobacterium sp. MCPF17_002]WIB77737.1 5-methyltetrahydropteroyltriglutamate--homocysteine S-methyltransferase [Curtobacterium sp. MCPF17_002]